MNKKKTYKPDSNKFNLKKIILHYSLIFIKNTNHILFKILILSLLYSPFQFHGFTNLNDPPQIPQLPKIPKSTSNTHAAHPSIHNYNHQTSHLLACVDQPKIDLHGATNTILSVLSSTSTNESAEMAKKQWILIDCVLSSSITCQQIAPRWVPSGTNLGLQRSFFLLLNDIIAVKKAKKKDHKNQIHQ